MWFAVFRMRSEIEPQQMFDMTLLEFCALKLIKCPKGERKVWERLDRGAGGGGDGRQRAPG